MWKTFKEKYEVNEEGIVRNKKTKKMLSTRVKVSGYPVCSLFVDGKNETFLLHRIVAELFCENDDVINKTEVNHKDSDRSNSHASNLEWVTHKENMEHGVAFGYMCLSKIPVKSINKKGVVVNKYPSLKKAMEHTGISTAKIKKVLDEKIELGGLYWETDYTKEISERKRRYEEMDIPKSNHYARPSFIYIEGTKRIKEKYKMKRWGRE